MTAPNHTSAWHRCDDRCQGGEHHTAYYIPSTMEIGLLRDLAIHARPMPGCDMGRLEDSGLVVFIRETRSGTTWYRLTDHARAALRAAEGRE